MSCVYVKNCPYAETIETQNGETHCKNWDCVLWQEYENTEEGRSKNEIV